MTGMLMDIPRGYTALAEWLSCTIFLCMLTTNRTRVQRNIAVVLQCTQRTGRPDAGLHD